MTVDKDHDVEGSTNNERSGDQTERIRQRALELYEARGGGAGHDIDDWLQAEAEIKATETGSQEDGA
jgi:hypothetical protein